MGEKMKRAYFWTETIKNTLKHRVTGKIDLLNRKIATVPEVISCHERSPAVFRQLLWNRHAKAMTTP